MLLVRDEETTAPPRATVAGHNIEHLDIVPVNVALFWTQKLFSSSRATEECGSAALSARPIITNRRPNP